MLQENNSIDINENVLVTFKNEEYLLNVYAILSKNYTNESNVIINEENWETAANENSEEINLKNNSSNNNNKNNNSSSLHINIKKQSTGEIWNGEYSDTCNNYNNK